MSDPQLLSAMLAKHSALQLNIDAAQRELDRRNAEGEDVGAYRVCQETGRIIKCAKAEAIANADAHTNNAGLPTYSELVEALHEARKCIGKNVPTTVFAPREWVDALLARIPS